MKIQSPDVNVINRDAFTQGFSQATFAADDLFKFHEDLYHKIRSGDEKGARYMLGIGPDDSQVQPINIITIVDGQQNTLLMHVAAKKQTSLFSDLVKYSIKYFGIEETQKWIQIENKLGHQCMHAACISGNIEILEIIRKQNIRLDQKTKSGQTALHIAAQGDHAALLYYLIHQVHLDLNTKDADEGTPLHFACFYGGNVCASLLLTWGCKINIRNKYGDTPLHYAASAGMEKIARNLLYYNAKTRLQNKQGRIPEELALEQGFKSIAIIIKDYTSGNLRSNNICGTANRPVYNENNRFQMICFLLLLTLNLAFQIFYTLGNNIIGHIQIIMDILSIFYIILIINSNPGYLPQYRQQFFEILKNNDERKEICAECCSLKPLRAKHCYFCKRCVMVYDHHCPWINNCVGAKNHFQFLIFIYIIFLTIIFQAVIAWNFGLQLIFHIDGLNILNNQVGEISQLDWFYDNLIDLRNNTDFSKGVQIECAVFQILVLSIYTILLAGLFYLQHKNVFSNLTTFEKLNHSKRNHNQNEFASLLNSDLENIEKDTKLNNCINMLCRNRKNKDYNYLFCQSNKETVTTGIISS